MLDVRLFKQSVEDLSCNYVRFATVVMYAPILCHVVVRVEHLHIPVLACLRPLDAQYCGGAGCGAGITGI